MWEITCFGVAWGTLFTFIQVYVVRLGAPSLLVGAMTYGPALGRHPVADPRGAADHPHRASDALGGGSGFFFRLMFLLVALAPFVIVTNGHGAATAALWVLQAIPSTVSNVSFLSMLADAAPAGRMTQVVGWRMAGFGVANTLTILLGGRLLQLLPFPLNYQVLFLIGFAASFASWILVRRIHVPDRAAGPGRGAGDRHEIGRVASSRLRSLPGRRRRAADLRWG